MHKGSLFAYRWYQITGLFYAVTAYRAALKENTPIMLLMVGFSGFFFFMAVRHMDKVRR